MSEEKKGSGETPETDEEWTNCLRQIAAEIPQSLQTSSEKPAQDSIRDLPQTLVGFQRAASHFYERRDFKTAEMICRRGLRKYPDSAPLCALLLELCLDREHLSQAKTAYGALCKIPVEFWDRTCLENVSMFLLDSSKPRKEELRKWIRLYREAHPEDEIYALIENRLEDKCGAHEAALECLRKAIDRIGNATGCAFRLVRESLISADFRETIRAANYGVSTVIGGSGTQELCTFYLSRTIAYEGLLHQQEYRDGAVKREDVERVRTMYETLDSIEDLSEEHKAMITLRLKLLDLFVLEKGEENRGEKDKN